MQLLKEKNSKFYSYSFPISTETDVKMHLISLRKEHPTAGHFCYAFQIGIEKISYRVNDDGEPNNSAGAPIYGQILSFELKNILVVVVRYFGGTKLGVGGLISTYRIAAQLTLENAIIIEKTIIVHYIISYDYNNTNKVMRIIKEKKLKIISQRMDLNCEIEITTPKKNAEIIFGIFEVLFQVNIQIKI